MRILFLTHSFNSLTQRLYVELVADGHDVAIEFDVNDTVSEQAVALAQPDVVIAPFLKRAIPESIWRRHRCLVVHPGIVGDRGPSALDWAILGGEQRWGVTVLEANGEMDAGDVWASVEFPMRDAAKGSLYRNEVTAAAVVAVRRALERIAADERARALASVVDARGRLRPACRQSDRAIDWRNDDTNAVLRKIRSADGFPGLQDAVRDVRCYLYDAHREGLLRGAAGDVIARRDGAICRATIDGALWITHAKRVAPQGEASFKLPAAIALADVVADVPLAPLAPEAHVDYATWRPIVYEERESVGYLHFPFYNGAMSTAQCTALAEAVMRANARPTRVLVLTGGPDFWSNGIHLNLIEAADNAADESWRNINAMNDLVRAIVRADRQLTIAAVQGNAGAGGVFLALAADYVYARDGVILNPHYKGMGNLYGSEYWTYLLPRRTSAAQAAAITQARLPIGVEGAAALGLIDGHFGASVADFRLAVAARAEALAAADAFEALIAAKNDRRARDERAKPLEQYRAEELERMRLNFYGFDSSYHVARYNFVHKVARSRTPLHLATHRSKGARGHAYCGKSSVNVGADCSPAGR
jgi:putative two-component system hydrogenase maturation factor HypX/HoxX